MELTVFEDFYSISTLPKLDASILCIPLGVNEHGVLEQAEITEKHWQHILVSGHAGKSNYMHTVLASLLLNHTAEQVNIWISDGMYEFNCFAETAPAHIKRVNTTSDPASYIAFIDALEMEVENRLRCLADGGRPSFYSWCCDYKKQPFPRLIIMVDGFDYFLRCLSDTEQHYIKKLENIVRHASASGITWVVTTQEALVLAQYIPQSFFDLFGIRIAARQSSNSYGILFHPSAVELARDLKLGEIITSVSLDTKMNMLYISPSIENEIVKKAKLSP